MMRMMMMMIHKIRVYHGFITKKNLLAPQLPDLKLDWLWCWWCQTLASEIRPKKNKGFRRFTGPMAMGMSWKMWLCPLQTSTKIDDSQSLTRKDIGEQWLWNCKNVHLFNTGKGWIACLQQDVCFWGGAFAHGLNFLRTKLSWTYSLAMAWWNEDKQNLRYFMVFLELQIKATWN